MTTIHKIRSEQKNLQGLPGRDTNKDHHQRGNGNRDTQQMRNNALINATSRIKAKLCNKQRNGQVLMDVDNAHKKA